MKEEHNYDNMSNEQLIKSCQEKDSMIDELLRTLKRKENVLYGKDDIMKLYGCQSNKALLILKYMMMCKLAIKIGKEYYCTPDAHEKFIKSMSGKEVFI